LDSIYEITGVRQLFERIDMKVKQFVVNLFNRHQDIDGVIHFAASKAVGESVDVPLKYYENNIHPLVYLLQEIKNYLLKNLFLVLLVQFMVRQMNYQLLRKYL
jgi:UDP-glucose 4-epimerase